MKKTTHTPGPWRIVTPPLPGFSTVAGKPVGQAICTVEKCLTEIAIHAEPDGKPCPSTEILDAQGEANARLIAAAPDLLAALKGIIALEPEIRKAFTISHETSLKFLAARTAIAAAEDTNTEPAPIATYKGFEIFDSGGGKLNAYNKAHGTGATGYSMAEVKAIIDKIADIVVARFPGDPEPDGPDPSDEARDYNDAAEWADQPTPYDP